MKHALLLATTLSMLATPSWACDAPAVPGTPEGASATMEEMFAGQQAVKAFQTANVAYRECLDGVMATQKEAAENGDDSAADAHDQAVADYNAAVSAEEQLAADFNAAIRAFRAANPSN